MLFHDNMILNDVHVLLSELFCYSIYSCIIPKLSAKVAVADLEGPRGRPTFQTQVYKLNAYDFRRNDSK